jgi:MFS family permease
MRSAPRALKLWNYRAFLAGQFISISGTWIQRIAQNWLILDLTGSSATSLGVLAALQYLPIPLMSIWGGLLADRYSKRTLLIVTQACMGVSAAILAALTWAGTVAPVHLYAMAAVTGMATAVDNPTRQSFLVELVGRPNLPQAVGLNSATFGASRLVAPAAGGALLMWLGAGWSFAINAVSFAGVIVALLVMRTDQLYSGAPVPRSPGQIREGLAFIVRDRRLLVVMIVMLCAGTLATNWPVLLALMSRLAFKTGPAGYGTMFTAIAAGAIVGALWAAMRSVPRLRFTIGAAAAVAVSEVALAFSPSYAVFVAGLVPLGLVALTLNTSSNSLVQTIVPTHMRGRVMAVYLVCTSGGVPLGAPLQGWVAEQWGARVMFMTAGMSLVLATGLSLLLLRQPRASVAGARG